MAVCYIGLDSDRLCGAERNDSFVISTLFEFCFVIAQCVFNYFYGILCFACLHLPKHAMGGPWHGHRQTLIGNIFNRQWEIQYFQYYEAQESS